MPRKIDLAGASDSFTTSLEELQNSVTRYTEERYAHLEPAIGGDARQLWISRSKLEEFLAANPAASGVRIYFAVTDVDEPGFRAGLHSLIFMATQKTGDENTDLAGDEDWVLVLEKPSGQTGAPVHVAFCPPPRCVGGILNTE